MAKYYYNVFENGKLYMEKVTSKEISERLGFKQNKMTNYIQNEIKFKGIYTFERYGDPEKYSYYDKSLSRFTPQMLREWRTMNARYGKKVNHV